MKKTNFLSLLAALVVAGIMGSCSDELRMPSTPKEIAADINSRFDFNSWKNLSVEMDMGTSALISVYSCDPAGKTKLDPIFQAVTDSRGKYKGVMNVGGGLIGKDLYAVCNGQVIKSTLTAKGVTFVNTARSRDGESLPVFDMADVCDKLQQSFHAQLQAGVDNTEKVSGNMRDIHIHIKQNYTTVTVSWMDYGDSYNLKAYYYYYNDGGRRADGTYKSVKEAFATPQAFYDQFINKNYLLTPAETDADNGDWVHNTYNNDTYLGRTVTLCNRDEPMRPLPFFNTNTSIGFVLLVDAGEQYLLFLDDIGAIKVSNLSSWDNAGELPFQAGAYKNNDDANITNIEWPDQFKPTTIEGDSSVKNFYPIVYGFEDNPNTSSDKDYDDVMFVACVNGEIDKNNIPNSKDILLKRKGIYLFEDMYPLTGDYDMNDVIVEYQYNAFGRYNKEVDKDGIVSYVAPYVYTFSYSFKPVHDGATYDNAFYMQYTPQYGEGANIEVYNSNRAAIASGNSFGGAAYLTGDMGEGYKYQTDALAGAFLCQSADATLWGMESTGMDDVTYFIGLNPYIYCKNTNRQVHLSKHMFADDLYNTAEGSAPAPGVAETENEWLKYYLTDLYTDEHHENYPFAIDIPLDDDHIDFHFVPTTETKLMFTEYPDFSLWVDSKGASSTGWYLNRVVSSGD